MFFFVKYRQVESAKKKVWQPPAKQKQSAIQSTATSSRTSKKQTSTTSILLARESSQVTVKSGPVGSEESSLSSASKVSETAVTYQSGNSETTDKNAVPLVQSNRVKSLNSEVVSKGTNETSAALENGFPSIVDASESRRLSDINEPTKQPVAARLATWKKRTTAMDNASTPSLQHSAPRDKLHTISEAGADHRQLMSDKSSHFDIEIQSKASSHAPVSSGKASIPVTRGTSDDGGKTSFPPLKDGEVRQRTLPRSKKEETTQPTWRKLGPATFDIQQKLTAMCENWKRNEIAEKSRKERAEDLAVVENRWRNGILTDEHKETVAASVPSTNSKVVSQTQVDY